MYAMKRKDSTRSCQSTRFILTPKALYSYKDTILSETSVPITTEQSQKQLCACAGAKIRTRFTCGTVFDRDTQKFFPQLPYFHKIDLTPLQPEAAMFARRLALLQEVKTTSHPGSRQDRSSLTKIPLAHCSGTKKFHIHRYYKYSNSRPLFFPLNNLSYIQKSCKNTICLTLFHCL